MDVRLTPAPLRGAVTPPASKSQSHRLVLAAALSQGVSHLDNLASSRDISATLSCVQALGARVTRESSSALQVEGIGPCRRAEGPLPQFPCGESGSTLRFLLPVALAAAGGGVFTGQGRLMRRPLGPYLTLFTEKGVDWTLEGDALTVRGTLTPGRYCLPGNVSSQFITGLLYALPLLEGPSQLHLTTPLESADYVAMTLECLRAFGVEVTRQGEDFLIPGPQVYRPCRAAAEADWSQAAFWYAVNFLGGQLDIRGMDPDCAQGDRRIAALYWQLARPGDTAIDLADCPDLAPPLAVMAAVRQGSCRFTHAGRLRMKESDRLFTVCAMVRALGGQAEEEADAFTVRGLAALNGGEVDGANDHRIVMAASAAAVACRKAVVIRGAEAVEKSYPNFFTVYQSLGGIVHVL